ncbi:MAG TPA: hypothetical protein ENJ35_09670 [Gammaproteobacteria bacterium]|nr:hypothetical protein [Gammaproteobacteria bacterium]
MDTSHAEEISAARSSKTEAAQPTHSTGARRPVAKEEILTSDAILKALKKKPGKGSQPAPAVKAERQDEAELIANMRDELSRLRGMMENQFSALNVGQWSRNSPIRSELVQHLTRIGLSSTLATKLISGMKDIDQQTPQVATRNVLALLTQKIQISQQSILKHRGAVALIGPAGAGKTTTIAKLTSQFTRLNGNSNIILVSADNHRIGAHEQLLAYGELFDVPVLRARDKQEIKQIISAVGSNSLVLVDTGSLTQQDLRNPQSMATMQPGLDIRHYLVLPATHQTQMLERIAGSFNERMLNGAIITKVDEAINLGSALTAVINANLPVAYWSDGLDVNSHLYQATAKHLVAKAVTMVNRNKAKKTAPVPPKSRAANATAHVQ